MVCVCVCVCVVVITSLVQASSDNGVVSHVIEMHIDMV